MRLLTTLLASLLLVACASSGPLPGGAGSFVATPQMVVPPPPGEYRINPLDRIRVSVFQEPDLLVESPVDTNGQIAMPLIGQVQAQGRTVAELASQIEADLGRYLVRPDVTVTVTNYASQRVTVEGAVQKPGIFPVEGPVSLLDAIALAEGTTEYARLSEVVVFRRANGERYAAHFDVNDIHSGLAADPRLEAGDVVVVGYSAARRRFTDILSVLPAAAGIFVALVSGR